MSTDYQTAIAYSHNFATAKPDILPTEKEHILGLCQTLESFGEDRDRLSRMFAQACETLGAVQEALGEESSTELTGFEPQLVKKTKEERDALAAHVENLRRELEACQSVLHQLARDGEVTPDYADDAKRALKETPTQSLAHLKAQWKAEALEEMARRFWPTGMIGKGEERGALLLRADKYRRQAEGGDT
ncbi:hypothetical protein [Chromohalobacter canadensis]|uniref:hypothetical protein n=1 Tax=Chromohalobacter canadensis TaxID=141389 RepID=UPI00240F0228|nr:hypothetical protein [Chromohalobacter canadensis]